MQTYQELIKSHQDLVSKFPIFYAFDKKQFEDGLKKLNTNKENLLNVGFSGFIKNTDFKKYKEMWEKITKETKEALKDNNFLFNAFKYELANHEYCITYDHEDSLNALNLQYNNLTISQRRILAKAKKEYLKEALQNE